MHTTRRRSWHTFLTVQYLRYVLPVVLSFGAGGQHITRGRYVTANWCSCDTMAPAFCSYCADSPGSVDAANATATTVRAWDVTVACCGRSRCDPAAPLSASTHLPVLRVWQPSVPQLLTQYPFFCGCWCVET